MPSNVVKMVPRRAENQFDFVIENVGDACKILQRELAARAQRRERGPYKHIIARAGVHPKTLYKIADGTTHWPQLRTCLLIFHAMGFDVLVRYSGRGISKR